MERFLAVIAMFILPKMTTLIERENLFLKLVKLSYLIGSIFGQIKLNSIRKMR